MNNHPSTKVRRRQNKNYHCGTPNNAEPRRRSDNPANFTFEQRHGDSRLADLCYKIQSGKAFA